MQCPKCQFANRNEAKFCGQCGHEFEIACPKCGTHNRVGNKFCDECGCNFVAGRETSAKKKEQESLPSATSSEKPFKYLASTIGERKYVTALFSDINGYTAMSEKLDPEEVKRITNRIFGEISKIVDKYDGFIEKYVGDAVMAIFGVPKAHEDDPIRAIKVAREIHDMVDGISPEFESMVGQAISMHTGINTGLVITGEVNLDKGVHGIAGDTLNVASRLCSAAKVGEILVGQEVFHQAFGHFVFEGKGPIQVKGKTEPLPIYKVTSNREEPRSIQNFSVLRAQLIGRKPELTELINAAANLKKGKGRIFTISGEAGTGKSRLVNEFRNNVEEHKIQWFECHAYPYTQNIPYFPLMDLLNRIFSIEEENSQETVRQKIESGIVSLLEEDGIIPYIGSLYSIDYPEATGVSPEFWKAKLQESMKAVLSALALRSPTVFLLENLHWADPSYVELLQRTLLEVREPAIVLCVYRPSFSLFKPHQLKGMEKIFTDIQLQSLSPSETQDMLTSLLMTDRIPKEVRRLVQEKAEGNPFYVEEMVNSLIESEILLRDGESWKLTGPIQDSIVSSTIHGIIGGRLDKLEMESKQVLQEASVIGRSFLFEILQKISTLQQGIDSCMRSLEQLDFIRTKALHPDLEYVFKHALTQEVAYSSLLISQRKEIHERIAIVMEKLFSDRLFECYEALAYHFSKGLSVLKAVEYLVKSGEKSHRRYSLEEAHQYFKEAYELLSDKESRTKEKDKHIIDLLIKWGYVHNCRGDYKGLVELLLANEDLAKSTGDKEKLGMFYAWLGWALRSREKLRKGYTYLIKALQLGEETANRKVIGYACTWLSWTCADRGLLDEALKHGKRAQELIEPLQSDGEFVRFTLAGLGVTHYFRGDCVEVLEIGEKLLKYGQRRSDLRCMTMGHNCIGISHYVAGSHNLAIQSFQNAIQVSPDIVFTNAARLSLGMTFVAAEQFSEAEGIFTAIMQASEDYGVEFLGTTAQLFYGVILMSQGYFNKGLRTIEHTARAFLESNSRYRYAVANYSLGKVYAKIAGGKGEKSLSLLAKNIGFLIKNIPLAGKKAEDHYNRTIEVAREIGAKGTLGQAYLDLGLLYKLKKKPEKAEGYISESIEIFKQCNAEAYLNKAKNMLDSL
jgi:class 3 adenylate cyclase/tetratricopeptide (TPR) repeat protein